MEQFLLALCGLPASGKTTLAQALHKECQWDREVQLISTDLWRTESYYQDFQPERENTVRKKARIETGEFLLIGDSIIHDDTNYYTSMRHELYELTSFIGCVFAVVHITTPLDIALEWNTGREKQVPEHVIERIAERFDIPGKKYAWDQPLCSVDLSVISIKEARDTIFKKLDKVKIQIQKEKIPADTHANLLDRKARQIVRLFLKQYPSEQQNSEVVRIKKEVLAEAISKEMDVAAFRDILENALLQLVI